MQKIYKCFFTNIVLIICLCLISCGTETGDGDDGGMDEVKKNAGRAEKELMAELVNIEQPEIAGRFVGVGIACGQNEIEALENAKYKAQIEIAESISSRIRSTFEAEVQSAKRYTADDYTKFYSQIVKSYSCVSSNAAITDIKQEYNPIYRTLNDQVFCRVVLSAVQDTTQQNGLKNALLELLDEIEKSRISDVDFDTGLIQLLKLADDNSNSELFTITTKLNVPNLKGDYNSVLEICLKNQGWVTLLWIDEEGIEDWWVQAKPNILRPYVGNIRLPFKAPTIKGKYLIIAIASADSNNSFLLDLPYSKISRDEPKKLLALIAYLKFNLAKYKFLCAKCSFTVN